MTELSAAQANMFIVKSQPGAFASGGAPAPEVHHGKMRAWISDTWAVFKQYVMASWLCVGFDKVTTHLVFV